MRGVDGDNMHAPSVPAGVSCVYPSRQGKRWHPFCLAAGGNRQQDPIDHMDYLPVTIAHRAGGLMSCTRALPGTSGGSYPFWTGTVEGFRV